MKSNLLKSIFISLILVMGVNNAWAYNYGGSNVYYYFANTGSWPGVHLYIWNGTWNTDFTLTQIANTKVYYHKWTSAYNGNEGILFRGAANWNNGQTSDIKANYTSHTSWVHNNTTGKTDLSNINRQAKVVAMLSTGGNYTATANANCTATVSGYTVEKGKSTATSKSASTSSSANNASIDAAYGSTITYTATAGTGYTFKGFSKTTSTSLPSSPSASGTTATASAYGSSNNSTYYAYFVRDEYSITYNLNSGSGTMAPTTYNIETATFSLPEPTRNGYKFDGWYENSSFTGTAVTQIAQGTTGNKTFYAKWIQNATYSLLVEAGDGIQSVTGSEDPVTLGSSYSITATPKTGYTFSTWTANPAANASFGSATTANTTVTVKNGSVTVTASATENMSTLTTSNSYTEGNPEYAAPTASVNSIGYETTATVTATAAGNGYTFTGWTLTNCTRTDGGEADATSITVRSNGDSKAATVIANYEKLPPTTVYIKPKTDWKNNNPVIICDGTSTPVTPYDCAGEYYTAEVPGGTTELKFGGNNETTLSLTIPQDDKVLYDMTETKITALYLKPGDWDKDGAWFAVYLCNGTDASSWHKMKKIEGTELYGVEIESSKLNSTKNKNVIFVRMDKNKSTLDWSSKWNQSKDLNMPTDGTNQCTISDPWSDSNADGSWHKVWDNSCWTTYSAPTYTITTESGEGGTIEISPSSSIALNTEVTVTMTPNPGYSFLSGTIKIGNQDAKTITATTSTHEICGPTTITAEFESNIRTVTFDANGHGTEPEEQTINSGEKATEPAPLTEEGYTFGGWYTEKECTTQFDFNTEITENITLYAKWTEIKHTVTISAGENGTVSPSGEQQIGISGMEVTATPKDKFRFTKWEVSGGAQVADNYGATTTITATEEGTVIAHFEELQPKTIYLKTVEGTTDGVKWYVKYDDTEYLMDELGCTGEYYRGVVPEQTEFQLIAKDNGGNIIANETRDGLVVPDNSNMLNLVSLAASGNKIFFKPNQQWVDEASNKNYYFAGRFWTGSAVWKEMTDDNGDGIYECEKPTNGNEVIFCLVNNTDNIENWGDNWDYKQIPTNGDDAYKQIPNGSNLFTITDNNQNNAIGTWSEFADTPVNGEGEWTIFEGATYRITFNHEGAPDGTTTPGVAYVDAQHNSSMPVIELESLPKNTDWKFGGYYTAADDGTAITNAFGDWLDADGYISNGKWVKEECVILYAHWVEKTPEITNVALSENVFDVGSVETVTATPTVEKYSYEGTVTICWKMLDNSGTVMDLFPFTSGDNNSVSFSVDGLTSGTYTVRASIYASACDTGEELSRFDAKITIVSGYKVTVKYLCGDNVIQAPSVAPGHATTPVEITAPEIGGYKFVNWELGDGIFSESDLNSQTISYTAIYDGYLTAKYEKRKLIFLDLSTLPNKDKWTAPHIYLYSSKYWDDSNGTGAKINCVEKGAMQRVPNTENIWYYDYETVNNFNGIVAFTSTDKMSQGNFWDCEVIFREDFTSGTPVFVPASDQEAQIKNNNNGKNASYYSEGYWVKYMDGTGYWMIIYNAEGNKELVRREFTSETQRMTMTSIVDLEAEHTYQYEIYRNDGYYYKGGDITYTNSSTYRPLNEANKHSIKTTETGDYTFTLDYSKGELQIKVQYPGEVGDYRILYTDDVRDGRYKPSQIISQNNKEPLVSFFVRPNNNPELKVQKATLVTEEEVKWDNNVLYLTPHDGWKSDGARFAAYFYNNSGNTWVSMTSIKNGEYYGCAIPEGNWANVIFCRMNPNNHENRWNRDDDGDNKPVWNQTVDLTIDKSNNQFTITNPWNEEHDKKATGTWSKHDNDIIDLSTALKEKLGELDLTNIKKDTGSVFNIHLSNTNGTPTIEKVALYTGNYYIRVDAVDGKWYDYKTNPDNLMIYSAFSESDENSFGEKFSHYKTKWCTREKGDMNVKFVIANDYSLCISDTLTQDEGNPFGNIDEHGNITNAEKYDANIRFMWNRHTNKVSRAYVAGASGDNTRFLVLKAHKTIQKESGQAINNNEVVFKDTENWLYERTIKVQPGTLVKLIAYYPDENKTQYFRGTDANGFEENVSAVKILGGNNEEWYTMRIIYDFKTNRLMAAWVPDQNINDTLKIDADIMVIRQHQEDATYITFANDKSQLSNVKTVYGVMRFNRWTLNNRSTSDHKVLPVQSQKTIYERALYFISFPFDVHLSDVFGFGTYGTHWVISEYNGLRRAQNGYFIDNCMNEDCTNWDYIWDPSNFTMKANQGYLLSLDLDLMKHDNTSFWAHDIQQVELFFPSYAHVQTIEQTSYTMPALSEDYECKINFNKVGPEDPTYNPVNDHRVRDSYWRCIGVPSFADYNSALTDGENKITWNPKGSDLPFLYEWNVSDNSLMVRAASTYRFRSTFAYLVQNGNSIYWSAVNTKPSNIVARSQEAKHNYEWRITLTQGEKEHDQAFVRLSDDEQVTTEFDFNQDLSKEFNYGRSDIYTLIGYEKAAANSLPLSEQTTLIPLGLSIEYNGDYTIAMPDGTANIGVTLIDTESNTRTNLSAGMEYTLTLKKGDYNNRFFIEISPIQQTPTDIEYVENSSDDQARKVLIDNILYIVRDGQMFDARGARVK